MACCFLWQQRSELSQAGAHQTQPPVAEDFRGAAAGVMQHRVALTDACWRRPRRRLLRLLRALQATECVLPYTLQQSSCNARSPALVAILARSGCSEVDYMWTGWDRHRKVPTRHFTHREWPGAPNTLTRGAIAQQLSSSAGILFCPGPRISLQATRRSAAAGHSVRRLATLCTAHVGRFNAIRSPNWH